MEPQLSCETRFLENIQGPTACSTRKLLSHAEGVCDWAIGSYLWPHSCEQPRATHHRIIHHDIG